MAGIEPATTRFQAEDSTSELHPEMVGRGSDRSMRGILADWRKAEESNPKPFLGARMLVFETSCRPRSATFRSCDMAEGVGIEPTRRVAGADYELATRCIAALPTFRVTGKIGLIVGGDGRPRTDARPLAGRVLSQTELHPQNVGAAGMESNPQPDPYRGPALPFELQRRLAFGFVCGSWCLGCGNGI